MSESRGSLPVVPEGLFDFSREAYPVDITRKNAIARALTPEYLGENPANYTDITYDMVTYVQPENLEPHLIGVKPPGRDDEQPNVIGYYAGQGRGYIHLAVTPQEAKTIPRSVGAIRRAARITTGATVTTEYPSDEDYAREERAGRHTHESKLTALYALRDNVYVPQRELIEKFVEATDFESQQGYRRAGLARFGNEGNMREALTTLRTQVFGDIVRAYARQRHLLGPQTRQVDRAITVSICMDREDNRHLVRFANLVRFSKAYGGHKIAAINQRIEAIERQLQES